MPIPAKILRPCKGLPPEDSISLRSPMQEQALGEGSPVHSSCTSVWGRHGTDVPWQEQPGLTHHTSTHTACLPRPPGPLSCTVKSDSSFTTQPEGSFPVMPFPPCIAPLGSKVPPLLEHHPPCQAAHSSTNQSTTGRQARRCLEAPHSHEEQRTMLLKNARVNSWVQLLALAGYP